MQNPSILVASVLCVLASGCKDKTSSPPATTGSGSGSAVAIEPPKAPAPPVVEKKPFVSEAGRQAKCEFLKYDGADKTRKARFKITLPPGKEVSTVQSWQFYYDKNGEHLSRYPASTTIDGESQPLGHEGDEIPKDTDVVECEISRIDFKDGTSWFNENLVPDGKSRPKGGVPEADLKAQSGEKVEVEVVDAKAGKVKLKNVSGKPVKTVDVNILYRLPEGSETGRTSSRSEWLREIPIIPAGATVEHTIKLREPAPEFKSVEAYAPRVTFEDGTDFTNANLSSSYR